MKNLNNLILYFTQKNYSANKIQKYLQNGELGIRRQILLKQVRKIKGIIINEERLKLLYTPIKYLSEKQKEKKYWLLYDKMRDEAYRKEQVEKIKSAKEFMKSDVIDGDNMLTNSEKIGDALNEMTKFMKYELEMK